MTTVPGVRVRLAETPTTQRVGPARCLVSRNKKRHFPQVGDDNDDRDQIAHHRAAPHRHHIPLRVHPTHHHRKAALVSTPITHPPTPSPSDHPPADRDDTVIHIVGWWQGTLDALRIKVPRALCGMSMAGDPDAPQLHPGDPVCPDCEARNTQSRDPRTRPVPAHRAGHLVWAIVAGCVAVGLIAGAGVLVAGHGVTAAVIAGCCAVVAAGGLARGVRALRSHGLLDDIRWGKVAALLIVTAVLWALSWNVQHPLQAWTPMSGIEHPGQ